MNPAPTPASATISDPASPGLMRFGNDVVVATPGQGTDQTKNYSVLDSSAAQADYYNKQSFADQQSMAISNQAITNKLKTESDAQAAGANKATTDQATADKAKADALSKATDAVSGNTTTTTPTVDSNVALMQKSIDDQQKAYDDMNTKITGIQNGSIPLTADQQAQVTNLQNQFAQLRLDQEKYNKAYEGGTEMLGVRSGINRYAGQEQQNRIQEAVDTGTKKITDLDVKAASAISSLKQGFVTGNIKAVEDAYKAYSDFTQQKSNTLKDMNNAIATEAKAVADAAKEAAAAKQQTLVNQQKQQDFNVKNNVKQQFYSQGGYLFNALDGSLIGDAETARKLGVADDLSNVDVIDSTEHSPAYKEWQDYQSTGGKLGFDAYNSYDANRKKSITNNYNGDFSDKDSKVVANIIKNNPGPTSYGKSADAIDAALGAGTASKYDALLKTTYLLPSHAQSLANDGRVSKMTPNQIEDLRKKFIQDNNYADPDEAGKAFDSVVRKTTSGRSS